MISLDEDALICDLAETYKIYDYRSLPLSTVATLAAGLRDTSRIKLLASGYPVSQDTILLAGISDRIDAFRYSFAKEGTDPPQSLVKILLGEEQPKNKKGVMTFSSSEDLLKALAQARGEQ